MVPKQLTLKEWNSRLPRPRSEETVRRWVREGKIYPAPVKDGREYLFDENAVRINAQKTRMPLLARIHNAQRKG
ncbi:excisionase [Salmonella enterica subsp. enterica serovar Mgulani]|nr:excisionase [Salmonella enterica subsp. enterica serovar Mgulani]ECG8311586.1 excisionase [Salmonella enterica subsp. enterica serovar Mgulani]EDN6320735.1 excisionase [Salmonella enterica]EDQ6607606.1 excisionase [Salmonella enterica subsp. enterica]EGH9479695.1 excisionase [Salmonella enterica]